MVSARELGVIKLNISHQIRSLRSPRSQARAIYGGVSMQHEKLALLIEIRHL